MHAVWINCLSVYTAFLYLLVYFSFFVLMSILARLLLVYDQ